jgi:tetratricopeptide (TPR) repeat protein
VIEDELRNEMDDSVSDDLEGAGRKFEQLILAEPEHHDGYEGLAVVYQRKGRKEEALLLIEHALTLARGFFEEGTLDQEILDEMEEEKRKILNMEKGVESGNRNIVLMT